MVTRHYEPLVRDVPIIHEEHALNEARNVGARFIRSLVLTGDYVAVKMRDHGERVNTERQKLSDELRAVLMAATNMALPEVTLYNKDDEKVTITAWAEVRRVGQGIEGYLSVCAPEQVFEENSVFDMYSQKKLLVTDYMLID